MRKIYKLIHDCTKKSTATEDTDVTTNLKKKRNNYKKKLNLQDNVRILFIPEYGNNCFLSIVVK